MRIIQINTHARTDIYSMPYAYIYIKHICTHICMRYIKVRSQFNIWNASALWDARRISSLCGVSGGPEGWGIAESDLPKDSGAGHYHGDVGIKQIRDSGGLVMGEPPWRWGVKTNRWVDEDNYGAGLTDEGEVCMRFLWRTFGHSWGSQVKNMVG